MSFLSAIRIDFDDNVKGKLVKTIQDMKEKLLEVGRDAVPKHEFGNLGWMVDFSPDSIINLMLRKTDVKSFAMFNEGNIYNTLFNKVNTYIKFCFQFHFMIYLLNLKMALLIILVHMSIPFVINIHIIINQYQFVKNAFEFHNIAVE